MLIKRNIGAYISPRVGTTPQAAAAAVTGTGLDRKGFASCVLFVEAGQKGGDVEPTTFSLAGKLQQSSDNGDADAYADITDAAITAITAEDGSAQVDVDLTGCERYIRAVLTPAFVGGTNPTLLCNSAIVLGGADALPTT